MAATSQAQRWALQRNNSGTGNLRQLQMSLDFCISSPVTTQHFHHAVMSHAFDVCTVDRDGALVATGTRGSHANTQGKHTKPTQVR